MWLDMIKKRIVLFDSLTADRTEVTTPILQ